LVESDPRAAARGCVLFGNSGIVLEGALVLPLIGGKFRLLLPPISDNISATMRLMSVNSPPSELRRRQVEANLAQWRSAALPKAPPIGWVRAIRSALGMSARALAERTGLGVTGVQRLERSEASGTITLGSLRKLAEALGCEVQYALVPRKPLDDILMDRAREVAEAEFRPVAHTMGLEDQQVADRARRAQIEAHARMLIAHGSTRQLW
jgi:predicted DNA-binding mobile mystery protein A